jgi:hypothetical protein
VKKPRLGSDPLSAPTGVNALIQDTRAITHSKQSLHSTHHPSAGRAARSKVSTGAKAPAADRGLPPGWTRATFIVRKDLLERLRARATFRKNIKTILDEALQKHLRM